MRFYFFKPTVSCILSVLDFYSILEVLIHNTTGSDTILQGQILQCNMSDCKYSALNLDCKYFAEDEFSRAFVNQSNLFILNLNIQSLQSKYTALKETISSFHDKNFSFDIICLQEVWNVEYPE